MYPELRLTPALALPTYFLLITIGSVVGAFWFLRRAQVRELSRTVALDLVILSFISGLLGARLLHVFYEEPSYYLEHPARVFEVWNGGFVYFGGLLLALFSALTYCQWRREPFWLWADLAALPTGLAYAIGRTACFFNGCCFGRECHLPWAVTLDGISRHPAPLYAAAWDLVWVLTLARFEGRLRRPGQLFHVWIIGHAIGRMLMESFRDDPRGPMLASLSLGTWIALVIASLATTNLVLSLQPKGSA